MKSKSDRGRQSDGADARQAAPNEAGGFSRPLAVEDLPDAGLEVAIRADAEECALMARRAGLVAISQLEADLKVMKQGKAGCNVSGVLRALVTQTCVVSLDPFETEIRAGIDVDFAPETEPARVRSDIVAGSDLPASAPCQKEPPDPIIDGRIDLGALVEEFLVLNLDPYPRKPGARFDENGFTGDPIEKISPFAVLKKLKENP